MECTCVRSYDHNSLHFVTSSETSIRLSLFRSVSSVANIATTSNQHKRDKLEEEPAPTSTWLVEVVLEIRGGFTTVWSRGAPRVARIRAVQISRVYSDDIEIV